MTANTGLNVWKQRIFQAKRGLDQNGGWGGQAEKCEFPRENAGRYDQTLRKRSGKDHQTMANQCNIGDSLRISSRTDGKMTAVNPLSIARFGSTPMTDPESALQCIENATASLEENRPADALTSIEKAVKADPKSAHAWYVKGCIHTRLGDDRAAAQALLECTRHAPDRAIGWYNLGCVLQRLGVLDEAPSASTPRCRLSRTSRTAGSTKADCSTTRVNIRKP